MNQENLEKIVFLGCIVSISSLLLVVGIGIQMSNEINELREDVTELQKKVDIYEENEENHWLELEKSTDLTDFEHNTSEENVIGTPTYDSSML